MNARSFFTMGLACGALALGLAAGDAAGKADKGEKRPRLRQQVILLRAELAELATQVQFANRDAGDQPSFPGESICGDPCTTDSDNDGIGDCEDICPCDPNTADEDGDLIPDCADPCPGDNVQACIDPCNVDSDGDGIKDCEDRCPWDPAPPIDSDNDGLADCEDFCPGDPENLCFEPCKLDRDGDGVPDCDDTCPWDGTTSPDGSIPECVPPPVGN